MLSKNILTMDQVLTVGASAQWYLEDGSSSMCISSEITHKSPISVVPVCGSLLTGSKHAIMQIYATKNDLFGKTYK